MEHTEQQSGGGLRRAKELSLMGSRPPTEVPGHEPQKFLGAGAYGEVWVALDRNTGRRVAIKFYTHRTGLDWTLLSREVEKLAFLSTDRNVVQLLDVGWEADPPYYVMEYMERGSLDDHLVNNGPMAAADAVEMFREVAIGLLHAHGRGVLHCDLKPANVLLDQDNKPRLADFGQSRLSHEQTPALGTLFYMAPEQADTQAMPDARWDVYALGALLYCMLTGVPPHRDAGLISDIDSATDLEDRLAKYRRAIVRAGPASGHRGLPGVDRDLVEIIDGCLAVDPMQRFANVQAVLDGLADRQARHARRPLVLLGAVGPALLVTVMAFFAWQWFNTVVQKTDQSLTQAELASSRFQVRFVSQAVSEELTRRYRAVEQVALDPVFQKLLHDALQDEELAKLRGRLSDPALPADEEQADDLRARLRDHARFARLQEYLVALRRDASQPKTASWFVNDGRGLQMARDPASHTIGRNYAWRTYFSGFSADKPHDWRPDSGEHVAETNLSAVFLSQATGHWIVTVSAPVYDGTDLEKFLGVVALTVEVGSFVELRGGEDRFAMLVDRREGENEGLILQHPIYDRFRRKRKQAGENGAVPQRITNYRLAENQFPDRDALRQNFVDPFGNDPEGGDFNRRWLAEMAPVRVRNRRTGELDNSGLYVIVQQAYDSAIGQPLAGLKHSMVTIGLFGLAFVALVITLLWSFVVRGFNRTSAAAVVAGAPSAATGKTETMPAMPHIEGMRK